eukprot:gene6583-10746_t
MSKSVEEFCFIIQEFEKQTTFQNDEIFVSDQVIANLKNCCSAISRHQINVYQAKELKKASSNLWNICVNFGKKENLKKGDWLAKLRSISSDMMKISFTEDTIKRNLEILRLFSKTGKEWSDCNNYEMAQNYYEEAKKCIDPVMNECHKMSSETEIYKARGTIFNLFLNEGETLWKNGDFEKSFKVFENSKTLLQFLPTEIKKLAFTQYNFGLTLFEKREFVEAIKWLKESFEIYEKVEVKEPLKQCTTLKLLSNCYFEVQNFESALSCIQMANKIQQTPEGLYLQYKLFLKRGFEEESRLILISLLNESNAPIEIKILACKSASEFNNSILSQEGFQILLEKSKGDELSMVRLRFFELLISNESQNLSRAKELLTLVISEHMNGVNKLSSEILQQFHFQTWNMGMSKFREKEFSNSLEWLQNSLKPLPLDDKFNRSKTLRFLSRCHLEMGQIEESLVSAKEAESLDSKSFQTHFLLYKIFIKQKNVELASQYLEKMSMDEEFKAEYYYLTSQQAYENGSNLIAIKSLKLLLDKTTPENSGPILRSLIQISLEEEKKEVDVCDDIIKYSSILISRLKEFGAQKIYQENLSVELVWNHSVCWNQGLNCSKSSKFLKSAELYKIAMEIYNFLPSSVDTLDSQKNCLLNRISCLFDSLRDSKEKEAEILKQILIDIETTKKVIHKLNEFKTPISSFDQIGINPFKQIKNDSEDKIISFLYYSEFKAKVMLKCGDDDLINVLENASKEQISPNTYFSMAKTASDISNEYSKVCQEALKKSLRIYLNENSQDIFQILAIYKKLIQLSPKRDISLGYFNDVKYVLNELKLTSTDSNVNSLLRWLMSDSWNNGVYYYKLSNYQKAEQWMSSCLQVAKFVSNEDSDKNYITHIYPSILEKLSSK